MQWVDTGGYARTQHVTTRDFIDRIDTLCHQNIIYAFHVNRRKPLPYCQKCIRALRRKLVWMTEMLDSATRVSREGKRHE
jgi:hypothetical protein